MIIGFLTDYGLDDEFVGVCKGVIASVNPAITVIDVTHNVPPYSVRSGALALMRSIQYLPDGAVVLAVVDPGVGTSRRPVALHTEDHFFVGPDNGLLSPAVALCGGALEAVVLDSDEHRLQSLGGATFDGRDVFAPAAAHLAGGGALHELGTEVDPWGLTPLLMPLVSERPDGGLSGQVLWVDRYGNAQLNISPEDLAGTGIEVGGDLDLILDRDERPIRWVGTYADAADGETVLIVDSYGLMAIARNRGRATDVLELMEGVAVTVRRPSA